MFPVKTIAVAVAVVLGVTMFNPITTVPAGHAGVVTLFGEVKEGHLEPGINVVNPFAKVHDINVQVQRADIDGDAASKDLQAVHTKLSVNYHLNPKAVDKLYANVGQDFEKKLFSGTAQDAFKAVTSGYTAEELISKREDVRQAVISSMRAKVDHLSNGTVIVDDVFITNFAFSEAFNKAIEAKQVAEQNALKATRDLQRIEVEAKQQIVRAQAEAQTIRIQADAIRAQGGAEYVQLKALEKWDGKLPTMMGGQAVPFINVTK
jgi:prohibitin 2